MASVQCHKTCEQSCQQKSHPGFGQKVADFFKGHHNEATKSHTHQYSSQTQTLSHSGHTNTKTHCGCTQTHATHHHSNPKSQATKNKGLLQNIKDRLSDHSSDDSSDSESDNENCHKRKD